MKSDQLNGLDILLFTSSDGWRQWLEDNQTSKSGAWLKIAKKNTKGESLSYGEALDEAICYGWIDSMVQAYDESYYLQKFSARKSKSSWTPANIKRAEELIAKGKMQPAGLAAFDASRS